MDASPLYRLALVVPRCHGLHCGRSLALQSTFLLVSPILRRYVVAFGSPPRMVVDRQPLAFDAAYRVFICDLLASLQTNKGFRFEPHKITVYCHSGRPGEYRRNSSYFHHCRHSWSPICYDIVS